MTKTERHDRITKVFLEACDLAPDQRGAFLAKHCGDDADLRAEIEAMLAAEDNTADTLEAPALGPGFGLSWTSVPATSLAGPLLEKVADYKILDVVGEGGMGVVYRAEQDRPRRVVALKVIKPGLATPKMLQRFEHEAAILGRLQHPGIAQIFEAGIADAGAGPQPFFAMEFIKGQPLTKFADGHDLGTRERLSLFTKVCDALQHAHQKGVIHRDLKPGNILVDSSGQPKILDFGVARAIDLDIQTTSLRTDLAQPIGTLPYMSPEQTVGDTDQIDTRSDVYALGVLAYELLAGRLPYDVSRKMVHEAVRIIREEDPTPLSAVNKVFRGDLETIVAKALEKDTQRRYQSASDFAADIHRYLQDEPIVARPPSSMYLLRKFTRRNRAFVAGIVAVFAALALGLITTTWQMSVANEQRRRSEEAEQRAQRRFDQVRSLAKAFIFDIHDQIQNLPGTTAVREQLVSTALEYLDSLAEEAGGDRSLQAELADGYMRIGVVLGDPASSNLGDTAGAISSFRKALSIRQSIAETEPGNQAAKLAVAVSYRKLGDVQRQSGETTDAAGSYEQALEWTNNVAEVAPEDDDAQDERAATLKQLGSLELRIGHTARALELTTQAAAIYDKLADNNPDDLELRFAQHASHFSLGRVQEVAGKTSEALESFETATAFATDLCQAEPENTKFKRTLGVSHMLLGDVLNTMGRGEEALPHFQAARVAAEALAQIDPKDNRALQDLGYAYERIGYAHIASGQHAEALEDFQGGLEARTRAAQRDPSDAHALHNVVISHIEVGDTFLKRLSDPAEAEKHYAKAVALSERLVEQDPNDGGAQRILSACLERLGNLEQARGNNEEALANYRKLIEAARKRAEVDPTNTESQRDVSVAVNKMGNVLMKMGKYDAALDHFRESLAIRKAIAASDPSDVGAQLDVVNSYERLGHLYGIAMKRPVEGLENYLYAVQIREGLAGADPSYVPRTSDLALDYSRIGEFQMQTDQISEAIERFRRSLELRDSLAATAPDKSSVQKSLLASIERLAGAKARLASQTSNPRARRIEHWTAASALYERGLEVIRYMQQNDMMDTAEGERATRAFASRKTECEQALAELQVDTEPADTTD